MMQQCFFGPVYIIKLIIHTQIKLFNEIVCNEFEFDGKTAHFHTSIR